MGIFYIYLLISYPARYIGRKTEKVWNWRKEESHSFRKRFLSSNSIPSQKSSDYYCIFFFLLDSRLFSYIRRQHVLWNLNRERKFINAFSQPIEPLLSPSPNSLLTNELISLMKGRTTERSSTYHYNAPSISYYSALLLYCVYSQDIGDSYYNLRWRNTVLYIA